MVAKRPAVQEVSVSLFPFNVLLQSSSEQNWYNVRAVEKFPICMSNPRNVVGYGKAGRKRTPVSGVLVSKVPK